MITEKELCGRIRVLEVHRLHQWVDAGLVRTRSRDPLLFDDADLARVSLICELYYDMAVNDETLPLVVSLMDQLYALRRSARAVTTALSEESDDVRLRITQKALKRLRP